MPERSSTYLESCHALRYEIGRQSLIESMEWWVEVKGEGCKKSKFTQSVYSYEIEGQRPSRAIKLLGNNNNFPYFCGRESERTKLAV